MPLNPQQRVTVSKCATIIAVLVIILIIVTRIEKCMSGGSNKPVKDTISVRVDTVFVQLKSDTFYTPVPYETIRYKTDTIETFSTKYQYLPVDTTKILKAFFETKHYSDTIELKPNYGFIFVNDTVSQNRIVKRGVKQNLSLPTVTKTVVLTQPRRVVAYLGLEVLGNKTSPLWGSGVSFGLQMRDGKYYGIKGILNTTGQELYGIDFKLPIRFRKQ